MNMLQKIKTRFLRRLFRFRFQRSLQEDVKLMSHGKLPSLPVMCEHEDTSFTYTENLREK